MKVRRGSVLRAVRNEKEWGEPAEIDAQDALMSSSEVVGGCGNSARGTQTGHLQKTGDEGHDDDLPKVWEVRLL